MVRLFFNKWFFIALMILLSMKIFAVEKYTFDKTHTYVLWRVSHFGFSDITGKFLAEGEIILNTDDIEKSSVKVSVPINSISTGIKKLDDKLLLNSYFYVEKYPIATFKSITIKKTGQNTAIIDGQVTIHGITKPIVLNVTLQKEDKHPLYNRKALGFSATGKLKRSDFDIRAYLPGVKDDVSLEIQAEAILKVSSENEEESRNAYYQYP